MQVRKCSINKRASSVTTWDFDWEQNNRRRLKKQPESADAVSQARIELVREKRGQRGWREGKTECLGDLNLGSYSPNTSGAVHSNFLIICVPWRLPGADGISLVSAILG